MEGGQGARAWIGEKGTGDKGNRQEDRETGQEKCQGTRDQRQKTKIIGDTRHGNGKRTRGNGREMVRFK